MTESVNLILHAFRQQESEIFICVSEHICPIVLPSDRGATKKKRGQGETPHLSRKIRLVALNITIETHCVTGESLRKITKLPSEL